MKGDRGVEPNKYTIWTKDKCIEDAKKYKRRYTWQRFSPAYAAAHKYGWLDDCCAHMANPPTIWSYEKAKADALRFTKRSEWQLFARGSYGFARRHNLIDEFTQHMILPARFK